MLAQAVSLGHVIRRRLVELGGRDGFVTGFEPVLSLFFTDPDGLETDLCVRYPDAAPGVRNPPGTPSSGTDNTGSHPGTHSGGHA